MKIYSIGKIIPLPEDIAYLDNGVYAKALARFRVVTVEIAVVNTRNQVLLVKRKQDPGKGIWWICGTKLTGPETVLEAAVRALENELGLDVSIDRFIDLNLIQFVNWAPSKTAPYGEYNQHNVLAIKITHKEECAITIRGYEHSVYQFADIDRRDNYIEPLIDILEKLKYICI